MTTIKVTNPSDVAINTMGNDEPFVITACPSQNLVGTTAVMSSTEASEIFDYNTKGTIKLEQIPGTLVQKLPVGSIIETKVV